MTASCKGYFVPGPKAIRPLRGTTLDVVGLGRSGRAVARRALAFGMRVVAAGRHAEDAPDPGPGIAWRALVYIDAVFRATASAAA